MFPCSPELHVSCMKHNKIHNRDTGTWGNRSKEMCLNLSHYRPGALGEEHSVFSTVWLINHLRLPLWDEANGQMDPMYVRTQRLFWKSVVKFITRRMYVRGQSNFTGKRGTEGKKVNILDTDKCGQLIQFIYNLSAKCPVTMAILTPSLSASYNKECLLKILRNFLTFFLNWEELVHHKTVRLHEYRSNL